jgi:hypothetical protein
MHLDAEFELGMGRLGCKLKCVFINGAVSAPLSVGWPQGVLAQVAPDGIPFFANDSSSLVFRRYVAKNG